MEELFVEDVDSIIEWNRVRASPDKQRFIHLIDSLFEYHRSQKVCKHVVEKGVVLESSISEGLEPIDIHNYKGIFSRSSECSNRSSCSNAAKHSNEGSLGHWMDKSSKKASVKDSESSVGTYWTGVSEMTRTSDGSICSVPLNVSRLHFLNHKRALAINRRYWQVPDAQQRSAPPTQHFPEKLRFLKEKPFKSLRSDYLPLLRGVIRESKMTFVKDWLSKQTESMHDTFVSTLRALHSLRKYDHFMTSNKLAFNIPEGSRFWRPQQAKPALSLYQLYVSKVPLGGIADTIAEVLREAADKNVSTKQQISVPPSPRTEVPLNADSQSLCSWPLTASDATHVTLI